MTKCTATHLQCTGSLISDTSDEFEWTRTLRGCAGGQCRVIGGPFHHVGSRDRWNPWCGGLQELRPSYRAVRVHPLIRNAVSYGKLGLACRGSEGKCPPALPAGSLYASVLTAKSLEPRSQLFHVLA